MNLNRTITVSASFLLIVVFLPALLFAGSATVSWNPNTDPDLAAYKVYYGISTGSYGPPIPVRKGVTSQKISGLEQGKKYYFAVTAVDEWGNESPKSAEATLVIPAGD
jgi:hypothetical protein